jgi:hypothetical protein
LTNGISDYERALEEGWTPKWQMKTKNIMKFKITFKEQVLMLLPLVLKNTIALGLIFYIFGTETHALIIIFLLFFLLDILPTVILHIQYLFKNWNSELSLNKEKRKLAYVSSTENLEYSFDEILSVHHFASYGGGTRVYSFGEYRYFKIIFKDNKQIIITCLMINNIKMTLEKLLDIVPEKWLRIIAFIY